MGWAGRPVLLCAKAPKNQEVGEAQSTSVPLIQVFKLRKYQGLLLRRQRPFWGVGTIPGNARE